MAYTTIDDPSAYFQTALWTGDGNDDRAITNDGNSDLQPDWIWFKNRSTTNSHNLLDSSRGITKRLRSDDNSAEASVSTRLKSFDSDGMTISTENITNESSETFVAWQWKANGGSRTTFTESGNNPGGGYQANTTAGFSIVDYTGTGSAGTVSHGLGSTPAMIIFKDRSEASAWVVYHQVLDNTNFIKLNDTTGSASESSNFNNTSPTSSVFTVGTSTNVNKDGNNYIAYCFCEKQGYSKIGQYKGNGNANGAFIYTGFKPAWVMWKRTDASGNSWGLVDHRRNKNDTSDVGNVIDVYLSPDLNNDDSGNSDTMDFLSNGFKIRRTGNFINVDDSTYVYMAFAESPFVSSRGVPTTAR